MTEDQYLLTNKIQETIELLNALVADGANTGIETALTVEGPSIRSFGSQSRSWVSSTFKYCPYTKIDKPTFE